MRQRNLSPNRRTQRSGRCEVLHTCEGFSVATPTFPHKARSLMSQLSQIVSSPSGAFAVLALASYLEVQGDACFQSGLHHSSGAKQVGWFIAGTFVLACYSLFLNSSKVDFGKLLGIYVVLFFLVAQIMAKLQFHQSSTTPLYIDGPLLL